MPGRSRWCGRWPRTAAGSSWSSPRPGRARPPPSRCSPTCGPPAAATSSAWPPPRQPRRQLAEATGITADTLARLTWALDHHQPLPDWADRIGPKTLLLIDEAGMADTLTLDTAIGHTLQRGGRVCLVGDDQQLGAIGAGGILTDLQRTLRGGPAHPAAPLHRPRRSRRHPPGPRRRPRRPSTSTPTGTGSRSPTRPVCPTGCWPPGDMINGKASTR